MPVVVDASTVIAVAANEPIKPRLVEMTRGQELLSAVTLPWEIGNAISAMFKQKRISLDQGVALWTQCRNVPIRLLEVRLEDCICLAAARNIYAYDAYVIQCGLETGQPILSLDGGLRQAARQAGAEVWEVTP
jgi:predicted nucleic acid-binding protein